MKTTACAAPSRAYLLTPTTLPPKLHPDPSAKRACTDIQCTQRLTPSQVASDAQREGHIGADR
eukprot:CAMPEP_0185471540 /NCGR_PEP_ID=MMETSP1366-20130426/290_1 /TAXON_ID=38817 /ORGANISM="Gephyrocapsa oceanica, Strain RCC1303" /LENGTH=62 /DNA_ID=CAMNT_0028078305 /DNA_START=55 /DNA_END=240 /DNA_ORIENTATION=+